MDNTMPPRDPDDDDDDDNDNDDNATIPITTKTRSQRESENRMNSLSARLHLARCPARGMRGLYPPPRPLGVAAE